MTEDPYFVRLNDTKTTKLRLLECSRAALMCSASYFNMVSVRQRKAGAIGRLKKQLEEVVSSFNKLDVMLPFQDVLDKGKSAPKAAKEEKKKTKSKKDVEEPKVSVSEKNKMQQLQRSLATIEKRINSLVL